jgi:hypothetical protein
LKNPLQQDFGETLGLSSGRRLSRVAAGNALADAGSKKDLAYFLKQAKLPLVTDQQKKFYIPEYNLRVKQPLPNN